VGMGDGLAMGEGWFALDPVDRRFWSSWVAQIPCSAGTATVLCSDLMSESVRKTYPLDHFSGDTIWGWNWSWLIAVLALRWHRFRASWKSSCICICISVVSQP
jgi:hypothetical protein